jgi:hypothetical protein
LAFFFFCLISLGQAYPYAVAFAMNRSEQCSCNLSGRQCIHGCDLKKRSHSHDHHAEAAVADPSAMPCHQKTAAEKKITRVDEGQSHWISPNCSKQKQREILSFQGDPFLPIQFSQASVLSFAQDTFHRIFGFHEWIVACESPPPKE